MANRPASFNSGACVLLAERTSLTLRLVKFLFGKPPKQCKIIMNEICGTNLGDFLCLRAGADFRAKGRSCCPDGRSVGPRVGSGTGPLAA
jgi:hypothetical protein